MTHRKHAERIVGTIEKMIRNNDARLDAIKYMQTELKAQRQACADVFFAYEKVILEGDSINDYAVLKKHKGNVVQAILNAEIKA